MLILGIDDAGRGPLIGPMILAGVLMNKEDELTFKKEGVADSKKLTHPTRVRLAKTIKERAISFKIVKSNANDIDDSINGGINLNTLEAMKTAEIINSLTGNLSENVEVVVDCPSVNTVAWKKTMMSFVKKSNHLNVSCEHKADANYPSVSAASILAKVTREEEVAKLKEEYKKYGDLGSGYPSDPYTKEFLLKHGKELANSGIFRKTWATWKTLFPNNNQSTLFS